MHNLKILAIDDIQDNLTVLQALVTDRLPGTKVLTARNGPQGLALARADDPDVILLDIDMPDMAGYTVCRQLKQDEHLQTIPVLFLTALKSDRESRVKAMEAGGEGFLAKPFEEVELVAQIRAMAKIKAAHRRRRLEKTELTALVAERTQELVQELAERKRVEQEREDTLQLLQLADSCQRTRELVQAAVTFFRAVSGFEAIGVRLRQGEDYPYYQTHGFPDDFVRLETHLCERDAAGRLVRALTGHPVLECMCGNVICGRFDPAKPFFTEHGTFWTNSTTQLLADTTTAGRQARNRCNDEGYESVALFPLRAGAEQLGLLQLNDRRPGQLTPEKVALWERLASSLAVALAKLRTDEALQQSEESLKEAQRIAAIGNWDLNLQYNTLAWSDEIYRIFEIDPQEFGASYEAFLEAIHPDDREAVNLAYTESVREKTPYAIAHRLRMKDGRVKHVQERGETFYDPDGRPLRSAGTVQDITERKQAEEEKEKLEAQLRQAQKMEAIGVLAGGIAHDFNNILGVIMGYTEMAREEALQGSKLAQDLDKILTSTNRAKELVKQIQAFSRQSAGDRMPLKLQPLVKEALKLLRASLPTTIAIKEDIAPQCGAVLADPTQIHQIVMNLCANAFHALETTGGVLSVTMHPLVIDSPTTAAGRQLPPGEYVELTVQDTGTGIGPDIIDKIFDPYFTTKGIGKGTGMGLSISHGIIKSYGGDITVASTLGQGTTFKVYFPVIPAEAKTAAEAQMATSGKGRILFIDDEELLAELGKEALGRLGYTVTTHTRSIDALTAFKADPAQFDLVITDQTMPGMTGIDLARRMLQIRPEVPIILCTGFSQLIDEEAAKAIGIREFAFKPLTRAVLGQLIQKVLKEE